MGNSPSTARETTSVCNWPIKSTQPGHPSVGRHNEYQRRSKINRHTAWCTSPVYVISQCLAEGYGNGDWCYHINHVAWKKLFLLY